MNNTLRKIWSDPVWSKVIASAIIGIVTSIIAIFWPPFGQIFVYVWHFLEAAFAWFLNYFFVITTVVLLIVLAFIILRSRSAASSQTGTTPDLTGLDWLESLNKQEYSRYVFLVWFPLNHTLKTPRYYFSSESIDHVPEVDELVRRRVIHIQRETVIHYRVRIDNDVYYWLQNDLDQTYPKLPDGEKRALEQIKNSDFALMLRGRSRSPN